MDSIHNIIHICKGEVKTTYAFSAFLTPFPSNFHFAWYQQVGEGGCYDTLAERYGERIRCFTLTPSVSGKMELYILLNFSMRTVSKPKLTSISK
jgi:hypothetical protein